MKRITTWILVLALAGAACARFGTAAAKDVVRPEEVKSMREVLYDEATYVELARLWKDYYAEFPSEYAYANWMYAARYAGDPSYDRLLSKGLAEYSGNPVLLYLKATELDGKSDTDAQKYLERAVALDPGYMDPWFSLVISYMEAGDEERLNLALRRLLESGAVADAVMDFNYNMLVSLDTNAILITNGDNDTYPGWILTRLLGVRPDVTIVNRSLLNTPWYPLYLMRHGLPRFIGNTQLEGLRKSVLSSAEATGKAGPPAGPLGDTLIVLLTRSAERAGRPVYLAATLYVTEGLKTLAHQGVPLGLVTRVTASPAPRAQQTGEVFRRWVDLFRTAGLDNWSLRNAPPTDAGRRLMCNYAAVLAQNLGTIRASAPALQLPLYHWYRRHLEELLDTDMRYQVAYSWCCNAPDVREVTAWCRDQGVECKDTEGH